MSLTILPAEILLLIASSLPAQDIAVLRNTHSRLAKSLELALFDSLQRSTSADLCRRGIYVAARRGDKSLLKRLYSQGILEKIGPVPLLCQAVKELSLADPTHAADIIATLISSGVSPNAVNPIGAYMDTPLTLAIQQGNLAIVKVLLSRDDLEINSNARPGSAVRDAIRLDATEAEPSGVLETLVKDHRTNTNVSEWTTGRSLLHYAIQTRSPRAVRVLLANPKTDVNAPASLTGTTPLMFAILEGALSPNGIPPRAKMAREAVLRGEAREEDFVGIEEMEGNEGWVFLSKPMCEIVELLLADRRIEVNARDVAGQTALHMAAGRGQGKVVEMLLRRGGVDLGIGNGCREETALEVARRVGPVGSKIVGMLERVRDGVVGCIYVGGDGAVS